MVHRPIRRRWVRWRWRCSCGIQRWPCLDAPLTFNLGPGGNQRDLRPDPRTTGEQMPNAARRAPLSPAPGWRARQAGRWLS